MTAILTLTCLLGLGISARAQDTGRVVVTVPFEFAVGGETLPADTYTLSRVFAGSRSGIVIRSDDHSTFLLPIVLDDAPAAQAKLGVEHVGDKYVLSKIETPAGVYAVHRDDNRPVFQVVQFPPAR